MVIISMFWLNLLILPCFSDMVLRASSCPSTVWIEKIFTARKMKHATSRSPRPSWRSWTCWTPNSTWTSSCSPSSSSPWGSWLTSSCGTRSALRGRPGTRWRVTVEDLSFRPQLACSRTNTESTLALKTRWRREDLRCQTWIGLSWRF